MAYLYAIHDPWFKGMSDGDVDDRGAFCVYEEFVKQNPHKRIIVYVGDRYQETITHYCHLHIEFRDMFNFDEIEQAEKICISAPVKDASERNFLASILRKKGNGYCQGCKIGCMNFPNVSYLPLLESVTNRYSTVDTMLTFPKEFIEKLDPIYYGDYQEYGYLKLISPGAIVHIPGLLYRLYCPELGGGPGTNMLTIQKCLQKHFQILEDMPVDKDHFVEFNRRLIEEKGLVPTGPILRVTTIPALLDSLTVMTYFANLIYRTDQGPLYTEHTEIYSLSTLPPGTIEITEEETPPLYDLVVAHAVVYGTALPSKQELLDAYC
jgi:hypothetical protein